VVRTDWTTHSARVRVSVGSSKPARPPSPAPARGASIPIPPRSIGWAASNACSSFGRVRSI